MTEPGENTESILVVLFLTNARLTLVVVPMLPIAMVLFMAFGAISQPLFTEVQVRLSRLNTILQENLAGIRVVKAFAQEPREQGRFDAAADSLMSQLLRVSRAPFDHGPFASAPARHGPADPVLALALLAPLIRRRPSPRPRSTDRT